MFSRLVRGFSAPLLLFMLSACGGGGGNNSSAIPNPDVPSQPTDYKVSELNFIQSELKSRHPDLFFKRAESDFDNDIEDLRQHSGELSDIEFRLASTKLVATIGDQHTYMIMHEPSLLSFPIEIWWVEERAIIIKATSEYQHLLGSEVISIDGLPTISMRDTAMEYLAYENNHWKDAQSPRFLKYAELLHYEGLTASAESASFIIADESGVEFSVEIDSEYQPEWIEIEQTRDDIPLYARQDDFYWMTTSDDVLFVQYNSCFDIAGYPLSQFIDDVAAQLEADTPQKLVIDMRFNHGGRIDHFVPFIEFVAGTELNSEERLFVLTGRHTFSSGVGTSYSFLDQTNATFVGMPTGGKPNGFSHVIGYSLSGSLNSLYMSTNYLEVSPIDVDTFEPDVLTPFDQSDFINGTDPALSYIRAL